MKKCYSTPTIEISVLDNEELLCQSGGTQTIGQGDTNDWFTKTLFLLFLCISVISCRNEVDKPLSNSEFTASITDNIGTRTLLDGNKIDWVSGDEISINGVNFTATPQSDATVAVFSKQDTKKDPDAPYAAYYPASLFDGNKATLPAELTFGDFSINPMYAESTTHSLSFKNICAVLAITIDNADMPVVKKIRVSSSNLATSGEFTVQGGTAILKNPEAVENTVTLICGKDGVSTGSGTTFYISIPAQKYRNLKVALSADGLTFTKSMSTIEDKEIETEASTIYPFNFKNGYDPLEPGTTIYGYVHCGDKPVSGVVVTDGYDFTTTDADGLYHFRSQKEFGFVEISIPSGYRVPSQGVIPQFFARLTSGRATLERHDFSLIQDADQTRHTMLFFTDIHLGNLYDDIASNKVFEDDINSYISEHPSENIFAATMGDNSFDKRWYTRKFFPSDYLANVDSAFSASNLQIFHCIGNHDHELGKKGAYPAGEIACAKRYKEDIGPTFYSYNIGKVHYICLDNIYCTNDGSGDASYECKLEAYMLDWLKKDLEYIDRSTPIVLQMHAPMWSSNGNFSNNADGNKDALVSALDGRRTYILSGHTHQLYTTDHLDDLNIIELNSSSVCGTWWVTQMYNPGIRLNREGTPAGYRIFKVDGTDISWQFKAYGRPVTEQIRTYDLNKIDLRWQNFAPNINQSADTLAQYATDLSPYNRSFNNNNIFFVVYDYDPKWTIEVWEDGTSLSSEPWAAKDPLHMISYETIKYDNKAYPTSGLMTTKNGKMFRVVCKSATSTVTFKITDRFGNIYTETMTRPKPFSILEYSGISYAN